MNIHDTPIKVTDEEMQVVTEIIELLRNNVVTVYSALRILEYAQATIPRCTLVKHANATEQEHQNCSEQP